MRLILTAALFMLLAMGLHGVSTKYINDFRFDNLDNFEFSNVSFVDNGGVELARETSVIYRNDDIIWGMEGAGNGFLVSSGQSACLYLVNDTDSRKVFSNTNYFLFSDIRVTPDSIYLSALPRGAVFVLGRDFGLKKTMTVTNQYIWSLVPKKGGFYALAGMPAAVYEVNDDGMELAAPVPYDYNALKGLMVGDTLYFMTDGQAIYKLAGGKAVPFAAFDNNVADFIYADGCFYAVTSLFDSRRTQPTTQNSSDSDKQREQQKKNTASGNKCALYRVELSGRMDKLFEKANMRFLSIMKTGNTLVLGTDKNAGYYEYFLDGSNQRFTSLGDGKFVTFAGISGGAYAVLLEPARIVKIGSGYAKNGYFQSSVFDSTALSRWGAPIIGQTLLPNTAVSLLTRSSIINNEPLWEDWKSCDGKTMSGDGRFFQYRAVLTSDGSATPRFTSVSFPYVHYNTAPEVNKISVTFSGSLVRLTWDSSDESKDQLVYDVFISSADGGWVRINTKPLDDTSFDFSRDCFPNGRYRVKVVAYDYPSNPLPEARQGYLVSDSFTIDTEPPQISGLTAVRSGDALAVKWAAEDALSPLYDAAYSINGDRWVKVLPEDMVFDSRRETFSVSIKVRTNEGPLFLQVKTADVYNNYSTKGLYVK